MERSRRIVYSYLDDVVIHVKDKKMAERKCQVLPWKA